MKYNPKVNEEAADLHGFKRLHPYQPDETVQGALELMYHLERFLCEIAGLARASLQPAAGAHGELLGLDADQGVSRVPGRRRSATRSSSPTPRTGPTRPAPQCAVTGWWRYPRTGAGAWTSMR